MTCSHGRLSNSTDCSKESEFSNCTTKKVSSPRVDCSCVSTKVWDKCGKGWHDARSLRCPSHQSLRIPGAPQHIALSELAMELNHEQRGGVLTGSSRAQERLVCQSSFQISQIHTYISSDLGTGLEVCGSLHCSKRKTSALR